MKTDIDSIVDDLLARWHEWRSGYTLTRGCTGDATWRQAQSNWSSYDRDNGVPDAYLEDQIMRAVDRAADRVPNAPQPWRTMIMIEARNAAVGAAVWSSMRLPQNAEELEVLRIEARNRLLVELQREGCVGA